jgi:hypothetical protein
MVIRKRFSPCSPLQVALSQPFHPFHVHDTSSQRNQEYKNSFQTLKASRQTLLHLTHAKLASNVSVSVNEATVVSTYRLVELILLITSFLHQLGNIPVQTLDDVLRSLNGRLSVLAAFPLPAPDTVFLFSLAVILNFELVADSALCVDMDVLHHKLHATGLASAVLLGTMLAERPPFEVAALVDLLVKETHVVVKL